MQEDFIRLRRQRRTAKHKESGDPEKGANREKSCRAKMNIWEIFQAGMRFQVSLDFTVWIVGKEKSDTFLFAQKLIACLYIIFLCFSLSKKYRNDNFSFIYFNCFEYLFNFLYSCPRVCIV